jgi:hypothetical protein
MQATATQGAFVRDQLGQRERASGLLCPWCHGGQSGERSLIAWWDGVNIKAKCKRAKCGEWGAWDGVDLGGIPAASAVDKPKRYLVETLPLADATRTALEARYAVQPETMARYGLRQNTAGTACYCPVYGPTGKSRGWVRRWLDGTVPKVKGYPSHDHPEGAAWMAWYRVARPTPTAELLPLVVCVEDVFSAMRLWQVGITSVALLGVSLTPVRVAELRRFATSIVVALDADAWPLAISAALRFHTEVRRVEPDIKDMTEEQLTTWTNALFSSLPAFNPGTPAPQSFPLA